MVQDMCVRGGISLIEQTELVFMDMIRQNGRRGTLTEQLYITEVLECTWD